MSAASAGPGDPEHLGTASDYGVTAPTDEVPATSPTGAWFVQLEGTPTARGGSVAANRGSERAFLDEAADLDVEVEVRETFSTLWNGVSVTVSDDGAATLAEEADSVVAVYPVLTFQAPPATASSEIPDLASAIGMTGADVVQSELGFTGEGIRVGVMDTGIDYDHPDFGGNGSDGSTEFPTERVAYGYDFVGDDFDADQTAPTYQPVPHPDGDPDDCQGHGTHVAGIVGANGDLATGGVRGVAPDATLGAYRVFGCDGSTTADIMIAAMERALADGMDVLNMSIGSSFATWPEYPTAVASDNLVDAGVVVVASIGNSGASGTWSAGAPGVGDKVIGVASYDNLEINAKAFQVGGEPYGYVSAAAAPETPTSGTLPLVALGAPGTPEGTTCAPITADVTGAAVLIERGNAGDAACDAAFYAKALRAQQAGAAAVVLYNNVPGLFSPSVAGAEPITIPVVAVSQADGQALVEQALAGPVDLTWTDDTTSEVSPTGGLISSFSSYGMTADLQLKPDIGAPGGNIWSTYPLEQGGHASLGGTSMASPHVAGAVALLLQARPDTAVPAVRDVLQNSADPAAWFGNPALGLLEPAHRQGAGMLDIDDAILSTTTLTPGKLSLGESEAGPATRTVTATNTSDEDVTYTITFEDAISTGGSPDNPSFYFAESTVDVPAEITVPAGGSASFDVTISPDPGLELTQYGGYLILSPAEGADLRIPYSGFAGDYQALPVLTPANAAPDYPFPTLATLTECERFIDVDCVMGGSWDLADEGTVYSMAEGDVPTALIHLEHPAQTLRMDVYKANDDGTKGRPAGPNPTYLDVDYLGRSGAPSAFQPYTWDGTLPFPGHGRAGTDWERTLPDGDYILEFTVVAALGDEDTAEHVDTWTSPSFTVDRDGDGNPPPPSAGDLLKLLAKKLLALIKCLLFGIC